MLEWVATELLERRYYLTPFGQTDKDNYMGYLNRAVWRGTKSFVIAVFALIAMFGLAGVAHADCNPGRSQSFGNWHGGWFITPSGGNPIDGSSANILVTSPYIDTSYANADDSAWVMLQGTTYYGQVGWEKSNGDVWDFWQAYSGLGRYGNTYGHPTIHNSPEYKVTYSSSAFHMFKNGTAIHTETVSGYSGQNATFSGEINDTANQFPGAVGYHVVYQNAQIRSGGTWYGSPGGPSDEFYEKSYFGVYSPSGSRLEIWDMACS
jgi:hypothetical protein